MSGIPKLMRVGELAKAVGKTVRAMHLYEELGLLEARARSEGGFRLYGPEAIDRIHWSVPDPAREPDGYPAFQRVAADLRDRVDILLHRIAADHDLEPP